MSEVNISRVDCLTVNSDDIFSIAFQSDSHLLSVLDFIYFFFFLFTGTQQVFRPTKSSPNNVQSIALGCFTNLDRGHVSKEPNRNEE